MRGFSIGDLLLMLRADGSLLQRDIEREALAAANKAGPAIGASLGSSIATGLTRSGKAMESIGSSLTKNVTLPVVAAGTAITAVGMKFDTTLRQIVALTDITQDEIGGVREEILKLAPAIGKSPQELAEAFYFLASGGFKANEALEILEMSAKAAASGLGDAQTVAYVVGASINAFGRENLSAADAVDQLVRAVDEGAAEAPDFAGALGDVVGSAALVGATFADTAGAIAAMTVRGISADESATSLNQVFRALIKTTPIAARGFADVGLNAKELKEQLREKGLLSVLQTLEKAFNGNEEAAARAFGEVRALRGVLALAGTDLSLTAEILNDVNHGTEGMAEAFAATEGPGRRMDRALARLQVVLIELSDDVLPIVVDLVEEVAGAVETAAGIFKSLPEPVRDGAIKILALTAALGPLLFITGKVTKGLGALVGAFASVAGKAAEIAGKRVMGRVAAEMGSEAAAKAIAGGAAESMSEGLGKASKASRVIGAAKNLGLAGAAFIGAGLAAGIAVIAVAAMMAEQVEREKQKLADVVARAIEEQTIEGLQRSAKVIRDQIESMKILGVIPFQFGGERNGPNGLDAQLDRIEEELNTRMRQAAISSMVAFREGERESGGISGLVQDEMTDAVTALEGAATRMNVAAQRAGASIPPSIAAGILSKQNEAVDAMSTLRNLMKNQLTPTQEIARLVGQLTSKTLAKGLKDKRPEVVAEAKRVRAVAEARLAELILAGGKAGKKASSELAKGLRSKNPTVRNAARRVQNIVTQRLNATIKPAADAGAKAANAFISSVRSRFNASGGIVLQVRTSDTTIGGRAAGGPVMAGVPVWINEETPRTELFVPSSAGHVLTHADAMRAVSERGDTQVSGGDTYNIPIAVQGALPVRTIRDLSIEMQRVARLGLIPPKRVSPSYRRGLGGRS